MPDLHVADSIVPVCVGALLLGLVVGVAAAGLSRMMYGFEDMFEQLPAALDVVAGDWRNRRRRGGLFFPRGLGVGYDNIAELLRGKRHGRPDGWVADCEVADVGILAGLGNVRRSAGPAVDDWRGDGRVGWSSGACLCRTAGAVGRIGMGAMLSGSLGVPLTAILFCLEITHCLPALLPLMLACIAAYLVTSLMMPRSILTEKLSRRGYHLSREYGVDPLELVIVRELMTPVPGKPEALPAFYTYADGTARGAAEIMATEGLATLHVVDRKSQQICGTISLNDLLRGRTRSMERESERLRLLGNPLPDRRRASARNV